MRGLFFVLLLIAFSQGTSAQIYRWTDANGQVHFSNAAPPPGVKATVVDANAKEGPPAPDSTECYTVRCQGERMEERQRKRDLEESRVAAEPDLVADQGVAISAPTAVQGTRNAVIAARAGLVMKTYTYMPTSADSFTTTITLVGGRVSEIERARKF